MILKIILLSLTFLNFQLKKFKLMIVGMVFSLQSVILVLLDFSQIDLNFSQQKNIIIQMKIFKI